MLKVYAYPVLLAGGVYLLPRVMQRLCTQAEGVSANSIDQHRVQPSILINHYQGDGWKRFRIVVIDNSWVAVYVLSYLIQTSRRTQPYDVDYLLSACLFVVSGSTLTWLARKRLGEHLPAPWASWISPRNFNEP